MWLKPLRRATTLVLVHPEHWAGALCLWPLRGLLGLTIILNLMALPFYLVPGLNLVVYYVLNGYLLGPEYFEVVALRRLDEKSALALRRKYRAKVTFAGAGTALLLTIPFINMVAAVLGTAAMVHLFQSLNKKQ